MNKNPKSGTDFRPGHPVGSKNITTTMMGEQADGQCWAWAKRKHVIGGISPFSSDYYDSWEEQAFAEDSSGPLGGCIWPPRSYSCGFCRREFRSAQALGGHMNVHRRDRARLQQQQQQQQQHQEPQQQQQQSPLNSHTPSKPTISSRVSTATTYAPLHNSPSSCASIWSESVRLVNAAASKPDDHQWGETLAGEEPILVDNHETWVETDLCVGVNSVDANAMVLKKRKMETSAAGGPTPRTVKRCMQREVHRPKGGGAAEEIDLELRLGGEPPKVK